jgi:hypothetical protein
MRPIVYYCSQRRRHVPPCKLWGNKRASPRYLTQHPKRSPMISPLAIVVTDSGQLCNQVSLSSSTFGFQLDY